MHNISKKEQIIREKADFVTKNGLKLFFLREAKPDNFNSL